MVEDSYKARLAKPLERRQTRTITRGYIDRKELRDIHFVFGKIGATSSCSWHNLQEPVVLESRDPAFPVLRMWSGKRDRPPTGKFWITNGVYPTAA